MMPLQASEPSAPAVPFERVGGFVRQITHDIRNSLNSLDLQAAYLQELVSDPEAAEEVKQMRALVHSSAKQLQALSSNFWTGAVNGVTYQARLLMEDFEARLAKLYPNEASRVEWQLEVEEEYVSVDLEMYFGALQRIFDNAFTFSQPGARFKVRAFVEDAHFIVQLEEPKENVPSDPATWGKEPFISTRRGGYGLGLFRAVGYLTAMEGALQYTFDSGRNLLISRVTLPLATPE